MAEVEAKVNAMSAARLERMYYTLQFQLSVRIEGISKSFVKTA